MNDCINAEVRDALPDLLHGRLSELDKTTMKAHVETCADCRAELALMERVRAYAPLTPSIDVSRIVSMLPAPSAEQSIAIAPARQRSSMSLLWKFAAAAALVVAGTVTFSSARQPASPSGKVASVTAAPAPGEVAAPVVAPTTEPTRVAVTSGFVSPSTRRAVASVSGLSLTGGVQDLTDAQLEALLKDVDNVDGLPAVEPEAISVSVEGDEGLQ